MKKVTVILFLLITLCYISGYLIIFMLSQQQIRSQMKQLIRSGKLEGQYETFIFSTTAFRQMMVDKHEFLYEGNMYDIASAEQHDEWITVRCLRDDREKALISHFSKYLSGNHSSNTNTGSGSNNITLLKFLQTVFIADNTSFTCFRQEALTASVFNLCIYQNPPSFRFYPPPELSVS